MCRHKLSESDCFQVVFLKSLISKFKPVWEWGLKSSQSGPLFFQYFQGNTMTKLPKPFCSETLLLGYTIAILYSSLCCQVSKCGRVLPGQVLQSRIFMMRVQPCQHKIATDKIWEKNLREHSNIKSMHVIHWLTQCQLKWLGALAADSFSTLSKLNPCHPTHWSHCNLLKH